MAADFPVNLRREVADLVLGSRSGLLRRVATPRSNQHPYLRYCEMAAKKKTKKAAKKATKKAGKKKAKR